MNHSVRVCAWPAVAVVGVGVLVFAGPAKGSIFLEEQLGNFPDAVVMTAEFNSFTNLHLNGDVINDTGFLFTISNSSWGDGASSSFASDPDGHFADDDILLPSAAAAIAATQSFGIYRFGAQLPTGAGAVTSAPAGWNLDIESDSPGAVEVNFTIDLNHPSGLLFDPQASGIDPLFLIPETGSLSFFVSTISPDILNNLLILHDGVPAMDVMTSLAWVEDQGIVTEFTAPGDPFDGRRFRPRGEMGLIPEPSALALLVLAGVAGLRTRHRRQSG